MKYNLTGFKPKPTQDWIELSTEECAKMTDEELKAWLKAKMYPQGKAQ